MNKSGSGLIIIKKPNKIIFKNEKKGLNWRANWIKTWLENIWIKAEALNKQELVTYLTDYYNPRLDSLVSANDLEKL